MKRIHILTEGQTEETFVRTVLTPHFAPKNIFLSSKLATTKKVKNGPDFKGGIVSYGKVRNDIVNLLKDTDVSCVTTLIDYYGLPTDFPGFHSTTKKGIARAEFLEKAFSKDIDDVRFLPHFQVHEFEAMLFVSPSEIAKTFPKTKEEASLTSIRNQFPTPEDINDDPSTAPSKRLLNIFPGYQKPLYGSLIIGRIGLNSIRSECKHFDSWITKLERI